MAVPILFFDVDGTIMDFDYEVPGSAVRSIRAARQGGALCFLCSGRPYSHVDPKVRAIGFDGYVCSCGMHVAVEDAELLRATATVPMTREVIRLARASDSDVIYESESGMYFDASRPMNPYMEKSRRHFGSVGLDVNGSIDAPDYHFDKIFCWTKPDNPEVTEFLDFLNAHFHVIGRGGSTFEVVQPGCSKTSGMKLVLDHLGASRADTYAFGDGLNDLDMMEFAAHGTAMGNARDAVKERADYITEDLSADGLEKALQHYHLI